MTEATTDLFVAGVPAGERERQAREAGRRTLLATVEQLLGLRVDRFAEINMAGFVELTDTLGGIPVCLAEAVREPRSGIDLPAGPQTVSGADALAFVRQRHGLDGGDLDRIARQQALLAGLADVALSPATLADPDRVQRLVDVATRHVVLDRGWALESLVAQLRRAAGGVEFHTIPTGTPALETPVDGVAVEIDRAEVRRFVRDLLGGVDAAAAGPSTAGRTPPAPPGGMRPATDTGATADSGAGFPGATPTTAEPTPTDPIRTGPGATCVD